MELVNSTAAVGTLVARKNAVTAAPLSWKIANLPHRIAGLPVEILHYVGGLFGVPVPIGRLYARKISKDGSVVDYGLISTRKVTTIFCETMVDQLITETSVWGDFKWHDSGTGVTGEDNADTTMGTAITDNNRTSGTQIEGTSVQYSSVGTIAYTTNHAVTEHGLFNTGPTRASNGLMDRSVFAAINVVNGDSVSFTYTLTATAGG